MFLLNFHNKAFTHRPLFGFDRILNNTVSFCVFLLTVARYTPIPLSVNCGTASQQHVHC
jgi:hypothetical protein